MPGHSRRGLKALVSIGVCLSCARGALQPDPCKAKQYSKEATLAPLRHRGYPPVGPEQRLSQPRSLLLVTLATALYGGDAVSASSESNAAPGVNVEPHPDYVCQLPMFCHRQKQILQHLSDVNVSAEYGVLSATRWNVSRECPDAKLIVPDAELLLAAEQFYSKGINHNASTWNCRSCNRATSKVNFIKLWLIGMVQYDFIFYMDLDVDFDAGVDPLQVRNAVSYFATRTEAISAAKDWASPVSGGVILFRPSAARYREALALVQAGNFDGRSCDGTGFNGTGTPRSLMSPWALREFSDTRMVRLNSWDIVCGDADQGLFSWYGMMDGMWTGYRLRVGHFWWYLKKPYECRRWLDHARKLDLEPQSICGERFRAWHSDTKRRLSQRCEVHTQYV